MPLFDTTLRNTRAGEKPQKLSDGGGLYLLVKTSGKKFWHMAYRFDGKQKLLSFGQYPEVSLSDAREARQKARELLAKGGRNAGLLRLQFFDIGFNPRAYVGRDTLLTVYLTRHCRQ